MPALLDILYITLRNGMQGGKVSTMQDLHASEYNRTWKAYLIPRSLLAIQVEPSKKKKKKKRLPFQLSQKYKLGKSPQLISGDPTMRVRAPPARMLIFRRARLRSK